MKKIIIFISFFLISLSKAVSLEKDIFFTFGPNLLLNTGDKTKSAPSPVMYSFGIGGDFYPDFYTKKNILFQAKASFFTNYYLWDGEDARPAEVENRTATALSAIIDLGCGKSWIFGQNQDNIISLSGGIGLLIRYGILSNGVSPDEPNRDGFSTASEDVRDINGSFYKKLRFLYPELAFSYSHRLSEIWKVGLETRTYIPVGSLIFGDGIDGMIFSLALKLSYK